MLTASRDTLHWPVYFCLSLLQATCGLRQSKSIHQKRVDRLNVLTHIPRLVLIPRPEGASDRVENDKHALMAALGLKLCDGAGQRRGIDQAGG